MLAPRPPLETSQVDVIIALDEEIVNSAAAFALKRFGFAQVHEAESADDVYGHLMQLQGQGGRAGRAASTPIWVLLDMDHSAIARQLSQLFNQQSLPREAFLVCAYSRQKVVESNCFHCALQKTFAQPALQICFENCQQWWKQGGGEPGRVPLTYASFASPSQGDLPMLSFVEPPRASVAPVPGAQMLEPQSPEAAVAPASSWAAAGPALREAAASPGPPLLEPDSPLATPTMGGSSKVGAGNSIESLDNLAPPPSPFKDVQMLCLVGRGSFGRVYRARWDISTVALKVVENYDQAKVSMVAFEGKLSSSVAHPNLVQTFKYATRDIAVGSGSLPGFELWIVQEWCSLGTLATKVATKEIMQQGGFPEVVEVGAEIASGAHYLHCRGIIHGDLTASNVLLTDRSCPKGYTCKISDFGLARVLDNGASGINTATMGTVAYMPPELFQLEGCALTKKVDVYAFGVLLWQLCTSSTPFEGLQPTQVVVMVAQGASIELPASVPDELKKIFKSCVARKPGDRPFFQIVVEELLKLATLT